MIVDGANFGQALEQAVYDDEAALGRASTERGSPSQHGMEQHSELQQTKDTGHTRIDVAVGSSAAR